MVLLQGLSWKPSRITSWLCLRKLIFRKVNVTVHLSLLESCFQYYCSHKIKLKICFSSLHFKIILFVKCCILRGFYLRFWTRLFFSGRSRKPIRCFMRSWISLDVRPWIRPKKVRVSLMVNSLYSANFCATQITQMQTIHETHIWCSDWVKPLSLQGHSSYAWLCPIRLYKIKWWEKHQLIWL